MLSNHSALLKLGYLTECRIGMSNRPAEEVIRGFYKESDDDPLVWIAGGGAGSREFVVVTAPRPDMVAISNLVRQNRSASTVRLPTPPSPSPSGTGGFHFVRRLRVSDIVRRKLRDAVSHIVEIRCAETRYYRCPCDRWRFGVRDRRAYLRAENPSRIERWIENHAPKKCGEVLVTRRFKQQLMHLQALLDLGYFGARTRLTAFPKIDPSASFQPLTE